MVFTKKYQSNNKTNDKKNKEGNTPDDETRENWYPHTSYNMNLD